jgi:hypothetical protein
MLASLYVQVIGHQGIAWSSVTGFVLRGTAGAHYLVTNGTW